LYITLVRVARLDPDSEIYKKARTIPERLATPRKYFPTSTAPTPEAGFAVTVAAAEVFAAFVEEATTEVPVAALVEEEVRRTVAFVALVDEERMVVALAGLMLELEDRTVLLA
jgi:hypothetical protein